MKEQIKLMNDEQLEVFVRERLKLTNQERLAFKTYSCDMEAPPVHKRFDMSGMGDNNSCHIHNTNILNLFADCGIYDHVTFLYIDAYKGTITIYYQWWDLGGASREISYDGCGTVELLIEILKRFAIRTEELKERRFS